MTDENDVAALRAALADHLRAEARYRLTGPLKDAANYVECLTLDNGLLADLTASETRPGDGIGWGLIGRYDPRTTSIEELIRAIIETNLEDELADLDEIDYDHEENQK